MNQALYAHMNNKRKMKKKKVPIFRWEECLFHQRKALSSNPTPQKEKVLPF
jgi:hypothetical protein